MFTNMLRPSRRHVHERISQNEGNANDSNNNNGGDNNTTTTASDYAVDQQSGPSIVVIDDQSQHDDLNLTEEGAAAAAGGGHGETSQPTSADGGDNNPSNQNNSDASNSEVTENQNHDQLPATNATSSSSSDSEDELEGTLQANPLTHPFLTSQVQTERELRYRRQSTCTLLILFFLVRLWYEAIHEWDMGLLFLSMMGTMWTYRWFMSRREAEEEFDRQITEERNGNSNRGENGADVEGGEERRTTGTGADAAVNFDPDLGLMSFQAQLALAILESQRQMFENGGYGGNERNAHEGPGVTNEAKEKWQSYEWGECEAETAKLAGMSRSSSLTDIKRTGSGSNYGSVGTIDLEEEDSLEKPPSVSKLEGGLLTSFDDDEEPSCSICLCEYEHGEQVTRLPCDHIYHESCLNSWTDNHVRCPLCNYDLMDGYEQPVSVRQQQAHAEEQRAYRNMALSTLGRRIRTRRRSSNRRANRVSTAAATLAAVTDDSIV
ncbi:hypothetical protein ACHAXR_007474 [Thalassiosira sp. AJA248-18]